MAAIIRRFIDNVSISRQGTILPVNPKTPFRHARCVLGRAFPVRHRREMAPPGVGNSRRGLSAVQESLGQYAKAGAHRYVIGVQTQLKPDQYEAELTRLASLYV